LDHFLVSSFSHHILPFLLSQFIALSVEQILQVVIFLEQSDELAEKERKYMMAERAYEEMVQELV
jgi:putative ribosome biogenesis GTPase RsgA